MRSGIYLGPRKGRLRRAGPALVWILLLWTLGHAAVRYGAWRDLAATRSEIEALGGSTLDDSGSDSGSWNETDRELLARLRGALDLGVVEAVPPTEVLRLLESTLPERVRLVSVSIEPSPPRGSLLLVAVAENPNDVTKLQESVASSDRVAKTQLLEERRASDGTLSVRLQVDLRGERLP